MFGQGHARGIGRQRLDTVGLRRGDGARNDAEESFVL